MFKLATKNTVTWPVTVNVPTDGGKTVKATFSVEFEVKTAEEQERVVRENGDLLQETVCGWATGAVQDDQGTDLPYSDEAKAKLLSIPYVRAALFVALGEINQGRAAARKN